MNELTMIRVLLDETPPSAEVIAEGRRRIAASATEPARPAALRSQGFRHRTARRVAVGAVAVGAAAALAFVALVPHGAPAEGRSRGQADELPGLPARGFLLTMAVKAAAGQAAARYFCSQMEEGQRALVGADDTTLQAPWDGGPKASLAGYRYAIFTRSMIQSCTEPPRKGWPGSTVEAATQSLGAQPASPADAAAWRRAGSPTSWIAWYDQTVRITATPGPRHVVPGRRWTPGTSISYTTLPTNPAQLRAFFLAHLAEFHNAGSRSEVLSNDALTVMAGPSTPAVRAAAYRVLASLPGIRREPNVQDPAGQSGTAVFLGQAGPVAALAVVDAATGALLCIEEVAQQPVAHTPVGTVIDYTLFVSSGWTNTRPSS